MKRIVALLVIAFMPLMSFAEVTTMYLAEALKKDLVKMEAVNSKGAYKGRSVTLTITNTTKEKINIKVDLGMILKPQVPSFQPMVLSGEEEVALKAHGKESVDVEVFCGNAPKACPIAELKYTFLRVGSDTLVKVLRFIKDHELFDYLGQSGVWAVTNKHPLSNVYDPKRDSVSRRFIAVLMNATGQPMPTIYTPSEENQTPAQPAYTSKTAMIYLPFEVKLTASSVLSIGIFNDKGQWVKSIFERKMFAAGRHDLMTNIEPTTLDPGKYKVKLMDADKTLQEKEITIEP